MDKIYSVETVLVNGAKKIKRTYVFADVDDAWKFANELPPDVMRKATTISIAHSVEEALMAFSVDASSIGIVL